MRFQVLFNPPNQLRIAPVGGGLWWDNHEAKTIFAQSIEKLISNYGLEEAKKLFEMFCTSVAFDALEHFNLDNIFDFSSPEFKEICGEYNFKQ